MNSLNTKKLAPVLAALLTLSLSACNRGYGCPTNFGLNENFLDAVSTVLNALF